MESSYALLEDKFLGNVAKKLIKTESVVLSHSCLMISDLISRISLSMINPNASS